MCYDARILGEYSQVLRRPAFAFSPIQVDAVLAQLEADGDLVTARPLRERLPDPDDEVFLAVALAGHADCLVTGNLRHYPASRRHGVQVVSPRAFWRYTEKGRGRMTGECSLSSADQPPQGGALSRVREPPQASKG